MRHRIFQQADEDLFSVQDKRMLQHFLLQDYMAFVRYFFKERDAIKFIVNPHHRVVIDTLLKVITGEITRLVINVPPGYTKTELAVIFFISYGFAINPSSRFMHLSYSDDLALLNSQFVKDIVQSEEYQELWPVGIREDTNAKKRWHTSYGGGLQAVASGGAVTGFRAGLMQEGFNGAFIIDDGIKPEDAEYDRKRKKINRRMNTTFKSRLAIQKTPMIIIGQRVHPDDISSYVLKGGTGEMWHHLLLPVDIPKIKEPYDRKKYPYGLPVEHDLPPGPLWSFKHTRKDIRILKKSDPLTYDAQYAQDPRPLGGRMFRREEITVIDHLPAHRSITVRAWDLAASETDQSPYTAGVKMSYAEGLYIIEHVVRIRRDPLKVENSLKAVASADGQGIIIDIPQDPGQAGKAQVQHLVGVLPGYDVRFSPESGSKATRASGLAAQSQAGNVRMLRGKWNEEALMELDEFPDGKFKDIVDACSRAFHAIINELNGKGRRTIKSGRTRGHY